MNKIKMEDVSIKDLTWIFLLVLWFVLSGIYWVRSGYTAVLLKWGNPQLEVKNKGLHWRIPFVERVYVIDQRNQLLKMASLNVTAADKNQITLSGFVLWRVTDPVLYYQQFLMSMPEGDRWFESEISALLSSDVAPQMAWDYLLTHASTLREKCLLSLREKVKGKGIDVVDVGLLDMRVSDDVQAIIIENMRQDSQQHVEKSKQAVAAEARDIRNKALMTAKAIVTKAQEDAMALTQQSEKESLGLLLNAYRQDPAFYVYYHRMKAYQQLLSGKDHWVVSSHDDFFKHLANPNVTTPQH